jgi:hypothetical protein
VASCDYEDGGLFTTTTVRKLLFEGFTDPSLLRFFNLLYEKDGISFECAHQPFDLCGNRNYYCDDSGVNLVLPNNKGKKLLRYGKEYLPFDEYFAPNFEITEMGK